MLRRSTVAALAAGLVLSTVAAPAAGQPAGFTDVPAGNVHADAIERAVELDLVQGTSATTFAPARNLTRGQVATVLANALERIGVALPPLADAPSFSDTGAPHEDAIRRLAAAQIVLGKGDGTFDPGGPVQRDQLASFVVRAAEHALGTDLDAEEDAPFDDVRGGPHVAAIAVAAELGLLQGKGERRFDPFSATRRDQAASVLVRVYDRLAGDGSTASAKGEVWSLDQGTDLIHVYDGDDDFEQIATIDVRPDTLEAAGFARPTGTNTVPHMIEFDSEERFAFIASTAGGVTIVVDARSKEVVEVLTTGAGSHMAAVTPGDETAWVAVIGTAGRSDTRPDPAGGEPLPAFERKMVEIVLDLDAAEPTFEIGRELPVADLVAPLEADNGWTYPSYSPICHQFDPDGTEAWITLGPNWDQGGLIVLDLDSGTLVEEAAYDPAVVKANCGVSVSDERAIVNWSGKVEAGNDTKGEWYVIDPTTYELQDIHEANGFDTHGLRLSPDGSTYWQVNRLSNEAMLIDAETLEVVREIEDVAVTPDILAFSPDGAYVYITQRGPTPLSGAIHAAVGDQPGLAVVDTETGETVRVLEPPTIRSGSGQIVNDVHGVGVRTASEHDTLPTTGEVAEAATAGAAGSRTVAFDAPRPEPTALGFHCGFAGA